MHIPGGLPRTILHMWEDSSSYNKHILFSRRGMGEMRVYTLCSHWSVVIEGAEKQSGLTYGRLSGYDQKCIEK